MSSRNAPRRTAPPSAQTATATLPAPTSADPPANADLRACLAGLLGRWQTWRTDPGYPGRGRLDYTWQAKLDKTLADTQQTLASLPADADAYTVVDSTRALLVEFWPYRPGPIADVASEMALLRVRVAVDRSGTRDLSRSE